MTESLSELQERLFSSRNDDQVFEYSQLVQLAVHLGNPFYLQDSGGVISSATRDNLVAVVEELLLIAARCGVNMEKAVWEKYPERCSYCTECPCICGMKKPGPAKQLELPIPREILSLGYLQAMLGRIYPKGMHSLHEVVEHVIEEIGETLDALAANDQRQAKEEFADIFAWIMQVANTTDISLVQQKPS